MSVQEDEDELFAQMALEKGWASPEQVREASQIRLRLREVGLERRVWQVCEDRGFLSSAKVEILKRALVRKKGMRVRIAGYEIIERLGQGGIGQVFRARQTSVDRIVALKILSAGLARDKEFVRRFKREARLAAQLDHPNIVRVLAFGEDKGRHYLAMEFVEGRSLGGLTERHARLSPGRVADIGAQVARALAHAHALGIVHCDVKPENLLLDADGRVKVADLGLALETRGGAAGAGPMAWTPAYVPPEQIRGEVCDARTDIYSLGATLFHLATARPPYEGATEYDVLCQHLGSPPPSAAGIRPEIPPGLDAILRKMMAKNPSERYASMAEVEKELERARTGGRAKALSESPEHQLRRRDAQRRRAFLVAAAGSLLLGLGLIAYLSGRGPQPGQPIPSLHVLAGEVWSAAENMPIAGMKVTSVESGRFVTTDGYGSFRLTCPASPTHRLRLEREGHPTAGIVVEPTAGTTWTGILSLGLASVFPDVRRAAFRLSPGADAALTGQTEPAFKLVGHAPADGTVSLEAEGGLLYAGRASLSHYVEAPPSGYTDRLDDLREGDTFFFRTKDGLFGKASVVAALATEEALLHCVHQSNGSREFPPGPSDLRVRREAGMLRLAWREVPGAEWYTLWRREPRGPWKRIARTGASTHLDRFAEEDAVYRYAVNAEGKGIGATDTTEIAAFAGEPGVRFFEINIETLPARIDLIGQTLVPEGGDMEILRVDRARLAVRPALRAAVRLADEFVAQADAAPLGGYSAEAVEIVEEGTYAIRTADGRYAKFQVRAADPHITMDFALQPNGSRVFAEGAASR